MRVHLGNIEKIVVYPGQVKIRNLETMYAYIGFSSIGKIK
jgi:hypothetical protein